MLPGLRGLQEVEAQTHDEALAAKDAELAAKDEQLVAKVEQLAAKDAELASVVAAKEEELRHLRAQLARFEGVPPP